MAKVKRPNQFYDKVPFEIVVEEQRSKGKTREVKVLRINSHILYARLGTPSIVSIERTKLYGRKIHKMVKHSGDPEVEPWLLVRSLMRYQWKKAREVDILYNPNYEFPKSDIKGGYFVTRGYDNEVVNTKAYQLTLEDRALLDALLAEAI